MSDVNGPAHTLDPATAAKPAQRSQPAGSLAADSGQAPPRTTLGVMLPAMSATAASDAGPTPRVWLADPATSPAVTGEPHAASSGSGPHFRLDGFPVVEALPTIEPILAGLPTLPARVTSDSNWGQSSASRPEMNLLWQAGQFIEDLRQRWGELERREQQFQAHAARFEAEFRRLQQQSADDREILNRRETQLLRQEQTLTERREWLESKAAEVEHRTSQLERASRDLDTKRQTLREQLLTEFQKEAERLEQTRTSQSRQQQELDSRAAEIETLRSNWLAEAEEQLRAQRESLWQSMSTEWQSRRDDFTRERADWDAWKSTEEDRLSRQKSLYEDTLQNLDREASRARESQLAELEALRAEQVADIARQQAAWEQEQQRREAAFAEECSQAENRLRLATEHLDKMRQGFDQQQKQVRHEQQAAQLQLEEKAALLARREQQADVFRAALDQREQSLQREAEIIEEARRSAVLLADQDRQNFSSEREAWDEERRRQELELRHQHEALTSLHESLETRRARLDQLRRELEETHRSTLELRLAVEETWARIAVSQGDAVTVEQVDEARQALAGHYDDLRSGIESAHADLIAAQTRIEQSRLEFQQQRQSLMDWINTRDQQLEAGERQLKLQRDEILETERLWQHRHEQALLDRRAAEVQFRALLAGLAEPVTGPIAGMASADHPLAQAGSDDEVNSSSSATDRDNLLSNLDPRD